jgi:menaquinone-dependent protoporphyrinogen IX oxidase
MMKAKVGPCRYSLSRPASQASKQGSTRAIAEQIALKLTEGGHQAVARSVQEASGLGGYDAFVIGSAT